MNKSIFWSQLLLILILLDPISSLSQNLQYTTDTIKMNPTDRYRFLTNHFGDNLFIGAAMGGLVYFGDHNKQAAIGDRLTMNLQAYLGKWFSPGIGTRIGINGYKIRGLTQNGSHSTGERNTGTPWNGFWLYKQEFNFLHLHGDVLFNLSNILHGHNPKRFYEISPYVGLGWMATSDEPKEREISAALGIYNSFRLTQAIDLTVDIRGSLVNDRFDGELGERRNEGPLTLGIGLAYRHQKRFWDRAENVTIRESYDRTSLEQILGRLRSLETSNDSLRNLLAESQQTSMTSVIVKDRILAAPILLTFPINGSRVSNEARVNLGFLAKVIKESDERFLYTITGYADRGTGTSRGNRKLSRQRADAVYDVLVNEFDVEPERLRRMYEGGVANMYYDDPKLSRAVITTLYIEDKLK